MTLTYNSCNVFHAKISHCVPEKSSALVRILHPTLTLVVALVTSVTSPVIADWISPPRPRIRHCHGRVFVIIAIAVFLSYLFPTTTCLRTQGSKYYTVQTN